MKRTQSKALTGCLSEHGTLNMQWSEDAVMNTRAALGSRLMAHKWKTFLVMLRAKKGLEADKREWKRNPRWLSRTFSREASWLWGHLGGAAQLMRGLGTEHLFKGNPLPRARSPNERNR